jgi:uncharacterized membrane protein required for colicin V production
MNWKLPFNMFDFVLLATLIAGLLRGRKHGMSEELMLSVKWLLIVLVCAFTYEPIGSWLTSISPISLLSCYLIAYICMALIILGIFALIKHSVGGKLVGSDIFGRAEYYLGMGGGLVRFACVILAALALLNARYFSPTEVRARADFQNEVYGSNYFPGLDVAQISVFETSLTGPWIKEHLGFLLIKPTKPEKKELRQKEYTLPQ